jgi:transposase-like protein
VPREDKRESPNDVVTDAAPKNLSADKDSKKNKGKFTHELEAQAPGARPSRKSSRGGANHIKPDSQQHRQRTRDVRSAKNRHAMRSA